MTITLPFAARRILAIAAFALTAPAPADDTCNALKAVAPADGSAYSGLADADGKEVIPPGKYRIRKEMNSDGRKILVLWDDRAEGKPVYYASCTGTIYPAVVAARRGAPSKYDQFANSAVRITADGKYGYMDFDGKVFLPPQYEAASKFCSGYAVVGRNCTTEAGGVRCGETRYIDKSGKNATEAEAEKARLASMSKGFCTSLD